MAGAAIESHPRPGPHHDAGGRFRNPWPNAEARGFRDVLKWSLERRANPRPAVVDPAPFRSAGPRFGAASATGAVAVTWIGHSTVVLEVGGKTILTDPVWSDRVSPVRWAGPKRWVAPPVPLELLPPLDLVLLSHNHYDHCDRPTIEGLARLHPGATWIAPLRLGALLARWGVRRIVELDWWTAVTLAGDVRVAATPAQHFSARGLNDRGATLWCGYALEVSGRRVYFAGDTAYHPEFATIASTFGPFDLSLIPIGAYDPRWFMKVVHLNPEEAVRAFQDLGASGVMVPIHWGTFKLTDEPMDEPPVRARAAWGAAGLVDRDLWVLAHGETRALSASR